MKDLTITLPSEIADGWQILIRESDTGLPDVDLRHNYGVWTPIDLFGEDGRVDVNGVDHMCLGRGVCRVCREDELAAQAEANEPF